ncbi:MAG TPA: transcription termination/antitermination protein NusG [Candidatus Saccharimonadales bacterium]|nr:transcription termination/antitermination protein NusG [Candidatus Saccharimonadales bacterium]
MPDKTDDIKDTIDAAPIDESKLISDKPEELGRQAGVAGWYVIHTYAGYEDQVAENINQRAETLKLKDFIFEVVVPKEKQVEIKNGKRKTVEKRSFPGYVFVNMIVTDESWYVVRNTPSVTGFLGSGVRPTPIPQSEIDSIKARMAKDEPEHTVDLSVDDLVRINDGPLKGYEGKITDVDPVKGKIKVSVSMFGRETPVNLDFLQVKKI